MAATGSHIAFEGGELKPMASAGLYSAVPGKGERLDGGATACST